MTGDATLVKYCPGMVCRMGSTVTRWCDILYAYIISRGACNIRSGTELVKLVIGRWAATRREVQGTVESTGINTFLGKTSAALMSAKQPRAAAQAS